MKFSTTLVFLFLFVLVAVFFIYLDPLRQEPEPAAEKAVMRLLPMDGEGEINLIEIQNNEKKESITLQRSPEGWMLKDPVTYPAQNPMVEGLVTALRLSMKARRLLPEKGWDEYGLAKPSLRVGIEREDGRQRRYLDFGDPSPVTRHVFARWEGESEYFLLEADLKRVFEQTAYSLRQKRIFRNSVQEAAKIRIEIPKGESYEITKKDGNWFWMEPVALLGDAVEAEDANEVLTGVQRLYIKDFLDSEVAKPGEYGFYIFGMNIKVWGPEDGDKPEVLHLGSEFPAKDAFYGTREGEPTCFLVAQGNVKSLFETLARLNEKYSTKKGKQP